MRSDSPPAVLDAASIQRPSADRDPASELFAEHATQLRSAVRAAVHTSEANIEDACAFAWLQVVRYRPQRESDGAVFPWLYKAAIREAVKLDRRARRWADLEQLAEAAVDQSPHTSRPGDRDRFAAGPVNDPGQRLDGRLELLAATQTMTAAGLRHRERQAVILRAIGYSRGEMAAMTGDSCRTVDRQLAHARRKLRAAAKASEAGGLDS